MVLLNNKDTKHSKYVFEKFSDKIYNDNSYIKIDKTNWGYVFEIDDSQLIFYDKDGNNITDEFYDFSETEKLKVYNSNNETVVTAIENGDTLFLNTETQKQPTRISGEYSFVGFLENEIHINGQTPVKGYVIKNEKDNKYGLIDYGGSIIIPIEYDYIYGGTCNENYICAEKNYKAGLLDYNNNVIIPFEYGQCPKALGSQSVEGISLDGISFIIYKDYKIGLINTNNEIAIPVANFDYIEYDSNSNYIFAYNKENSEVNFVNIYDLNGKFINQIKFKDPISIYNLRLGIKDQDTIYIITNGQGYRNYNNENVEYIGKFSNTDTVIKYESDGMQYLYKYNGEKLVDEPYKNIERSYDNDVFIACKEEKSNCGFINDKGEKLTDFVYEYYYDNYFILCDEYSGYSCLYNDETIVFFKDGDVISKDFDSSIMTNKY